MAVGLILLLIFLKVSIKNPEVSGKSHKNDESKHELETPVTLNSQLYIEDLLTGNINKNKIFEKDNLSLYLNNELGTPTLLIAYKDSLSEMQRNSRFLTFLYLKNPSEWKKASNRNLDYIQLAKESMVPIKREFNHRPYYIFKFRLEHPHFNINNLKEIEFLRHTREFGGFEEIRYPLDDNHYVYPVANSLKNLQISVKLKNLEKISRKRAEALKSGILISNDDDYVKAKVSLDDKKNIPAKMRLKGDWTDHLEHDTKWSYRIIPDGEETLFGMRKFSIQHPKSRNYIWEWLFNKVSKDNDITGLRYDFLNVQLKVSDRDSIVPMGIMALEEGFDKILIENNRRREGLILGLDESMFWDERKQVKDFSLEYPKDADVKRPIDLPIKVYNQNKVLSSPTLSKQFEMAKILLVGLRNNTLKLSEAFDVDKLTLYIAISNLFGGHHGLHTENIRIYYNPVTNKLEPISFDSNSGHKISYLREYPIGIHDEVFKEKLVQNYQKVSSEAFIEGFVNKYLQEINWITLSLSGEYDTANIDLDVLQHNANLIKKKVAPNATIASSLVSFEGHEMAIEIRNFAEFPVVIENLVLPNGKALNQSTQKTVVLPNDTLIRRFRLKQSFNNAFVSKKNKEGGFRFPKDLKKIRLKHHVLGSSLKKQNEIYPYTSLVNEDIVNDSKLDNDLESFDFISIDNESKSLVFKPGAFTIDRILYIPEHYKVEIQAGFNLDLTNGASIISYSPFLCIGTKESPITFTSKDNTGGGIFLSSTPEKSILKHTNFAGLSVPRLSLWELSGAVNFNETLVDIENCSFSENRSEDALNIIRSEFVVDSTAFANTYSDAFDGDFVNGSITNSVFTNAGNDGIDVSGSDITLKNVTIINPSDKALSAGEGSTLNGSSVNIKGGEIGVVSKDLSRINLTDVAIENTRLGIACFQKKTEFGPGIVDLKNLKFLGVEVSYLIEESSELIIDNIAIQDKSNQVIDKMYGKEYGKSSR